MERGPLEGSQARWATTELDESGEREGDGEEAPRGLRRVAMPLVRPVKVEGGVLPSFRLKQGLRPLLHNYFMVLSGVF